MRVNRRSAIVGIASAAAAGQIPGQAIASQCLVDHREITLGRDIEGNQAVIRLREYVCRLEGGAPLVKVQFHRLSDVAANVLVTNRLPPALKSIFGQYRLVRNSTLHAYNSLLDQFGFSEVRPEMTMAVAVPPGGAGTKTPMRLTNHEKPNSIRSVELPTFANMPLLADLIHIRDKPTWPDGWRYFYQKPFDGDNSRLIYATTLWRFANTADLRNFPNNVAKINSNLKASKTRQYIDRYLKLIGHVARNGELPQDFVMLVGESNDCGGSISFDAVGREFLLDVAVIENASQSDMRLSALIGQAVPAATIRPVRNLDQSKGRERIEAQETLRAGEKLIVPTRIFARASLNDYFFRHQSEGREELIAQAHAVHTRARAASPETTVSWKGAVVPSNRDSEQVVRKRLGSFGPPSVPSAANYSYGPETIINGIEVDGQVTIFEGTSANFLNLTVASGEGSCPILYFRTARNQRWARSGKVIHNATERTKKMSESVPLPGLIREILLTEEELEVASIEAISLRLVLKDGRTLEAKPVSAALKEQDGEYTRIFTGDRLRIIFDLPTEITATDVASSIITVTGYYERYSDLIATRRTPFDPPSPHHSGTSAAPIGK